MIALARPWGVWYLPPSWCAMAWTYPTLARVNARPAYVAANDICSRAARFLPFLYAMRKFP